MTALPLTAAPADRGLLSVARHCLVESRPVVQVVFLMRFLVGVVCGVVGADDWSWSGVLLGGLAMTCAVMAAYLLNGVMDIAEDRANGSRRPIARGALPVRTAVAGVWVLSGAALGLSILVPGEFWFIVLSLFLGYAYSVPPLAAKRRTATSAAAVITMGASSYLSGAVSAGGGIAEEPLVFCGLLALWMGFVGAVTKDLGDIAGDREAGRRTIAVVYGERAARLFAAASAVVLGTAGLLLGLHTEPVLLAGALPLALGAGWVAVRCLWPDTDQARGPYRAFMVTQYAANAGLALGLLVGK
ncbi:UbiA family prenyltransferase [Kitasatospora sp. NPDC005856]|uniref:UbiA prenyltransferase family protein n=1 Tax=Kitasatospora sp. NPDC005856 TaxID=3154566 RepID=UPI0033EC591E